MRKKIVAGNWKMNTTVPEGVALAQELATRKAEIPAGVKLIVAPPFTHLSAVGEALKGSPIALSAQNCADEPKGAFTGEVSAAMLRSVGCRYTILGHSERRQYYGETADKLIKKIRLALAEGLDVIYCVGENLEQRNAGEHFVVVGTQIQDVLFDLTPEEFRRIIVAYEPVWAIGTGVTATAEQAQEIHAFIRHFLADRFGIAEAEATTILYGGSCKPSNAAELFACPDIDGGLIGGAALKADDFLAIAKARG
ncbi:MAG: triose-phosphate isomerase [Bacteroidales bacterium]|nr:triose-phosphate isomerase [Bacteroidales bacterium]